MSKSLGNHAMSSRGGDFGGQTRVLSFSELLVQSEWVPSSERDRCKVCAIKYTTFRRKHHCRLCGEVVCGSCTMKTDAFLPVLGFTKVKICKPCNVTANDEQPAKHRGRMSDMSLTVESTADMEVSQKELDDLEALISPNTINFEKRKFTGWDVNDLQVRWYPAEQLDDLRKLSSDEHASVWIVNHQGRRKFVAKRLAKEGRTQQSAGDFVDDIKLVSKLQHPRIVELVGVSWTRDRDLQALFEYLPGGDLRAYLDQTASEAFVCQQRMVEKLRIALDIAEALAYLHSLEQPLHHRALESRNVLLTAYNRAKIGGFGAVRVDLATKTDSKSCSEVARWLAPEVLTDSSTYNSSCDIYSLGVIMTELDTHLIPFSDYHGPQGNTLPTVAVMFLITLDQARPSMSASCPPEIRQLTSECLSFEPEKRPTAIDVVARLRSFIRTLGLANTLEASKTPQQRQQPGVVLCDESVL